MQELRKQWLTSKNHTDLEHLYYIIHRGLALKSPQTPESQLMRLKKSFSPVTNKTKIEMGGRRQYDTLLQLLLTALQRAKPTDFDINAIANCYHLLQREFLR